LYFAVLSPRQALPVLICPALVATAKSLIVFVFALSSLAFVHRAAD